MTTLANTLIAMIADDAIVAKIDAAHAANKIKHEDGKEYNQRTDNVSLAHVRCVLSKVGKHNDLYGNIVTLGDVALKHPACKRELRLAIYALKMDGEQWSKRGHPVAIAKRCAELMQTTASEPQAAQAGA
jgi:hypothetical protein